MKGRDAHMTGDAVKRSTKAPRPLLSGHMILEMAGFINYDLCVRVGMQINARNIFSNRHKKLCTVF